MKNRKSILFCILTAAVVFAGSAYTMIRQYGNSVLSNFTQPKAIPSSRGWFVIWAFLVFLWTLGSIPVFASKLSLRRKRNIFLNVIVLALLFFIWNYQFLIKANFTGAIAISIADLLLAVVVWLMYLVTDKIGGYLFTPTVVWSAFMIYLSVSAFVLNK